MGVSVEGGKGRGRKTNFELNLVPFIDLLSVQITFLLATAVWVEISSLPVDQALSDPTAEPPPPQDPPPPPPLTIHVRADGVWVGRKVEEGANIGLVGEEIDWDKVDKEVMSDRRAYPEEQQVIIVTDDGVEYEQFIEALDISKVHGYSLPLLGGGPAQPTTSVRR